MLAEQTVTDSLIKVVEVWQPNESGDKLELGGGIYHDLDEFRSASENVTFELGEPLPGVVWQERSPRILDDLFENAFKRSDAARDAGLTSGLAIPLIDGDELRAVVLMFCDHSAGAQGAFEVWGRDHRMELGLSSEYYANLTRFSTISQYVKFPRGSGLPGGVWDNHSPKIIDGLTPSAGFTRASGMGAEGLDVAVGLPVMRNSHDLEAVVLILSSNTTPMAKVFEVWTTDADQSSLELCHAAYGLHHPLEGASSDLRYTAGHGLVGQVWSQRRPIITEDLAAMDIPRADLLRSAGLTSALAMPVFVGSQLTAVFVMMT